MEPRLDTRRTGERYGWRQAMATNDNLIVQCRVCAGGKVRKVAKPLEVERHVALAALGVQGIEIRCEVDRTATK